MLPISQSDIIKENKRVRQHKIIDELIKLEEINFNQDLELVGSILVPTNHQYIKNATCESSAPTYSKELYRTFIDPCILEILTIQGVILAGGAALWAAMRLEESISEMDSKNKPKDWDLFLYTGDIDSDDELRDFFLLKENQIVQIIEKYYYQFNIFKCKGVITIITEEITIQIILRDYYSKDEIAISFDISACSIIYDGIDVYFTKMAAWSFINKLIIVLLRYRSTTYEKRLKKYFKKGFGLIFPKLKHFEQLNTFGANKVELPYLTLHICSYVSKNIAIGWIDLPNLNVIERTNIINNNGLNKIGINYDDISTIIVSNTIMPKSKMLEHNIEELLKNSNYFIHSYIYNRENREYTIPKYHIFSHFQINNIVSEKGYIHFIDRAIKKIIYKNKNYYKLDQKIFDVLFIEYEQYDILKNEIESIIHEINNRIEDEVSIASAKVIINGAFFKLAKDELIKLYKTKKNKYIDWCIKINRDIELTGSLHPSYIPANAWYGDYYMDSTIKCNKIMTSELNKILFDFVNSYELILCPLCFEYINYFKNNIIILDCGHIYHYNASSICEGIKKWIKVKNICPECRESDPIKEEYF